MKTEIDPLSNLATQPCRRVSTMPWNPGIVPIRCLLEEYCVLGGEPFCIRGGAVLSNGFAPRFELHDDGWCMFAASRNQIVFNLR